VASRVDTIILRYLQDFGSAEKGFTRLQKHTADLNDETKSTTASVKQLLSEAAKSATQRKAELFDLDQFDDVIGELDRIENEAKGLGTTLRSIFNVDPKVGRIARDQVTAIQQFRSELQATIGTLSAQRTLLDQIAVQEERRNKAAAEGRGQAVGGHAAQIAFLSKQLREVEDQSGGFERTFARLKGSAADVGKLGTSLERAGASAASFGGKVDGLLARLRQIFPVVRGLAVVLVTALIPAIIALGGAVAGAGVAFAGMAGAAVNALAPTLAVLGGFFSRLGAVMDAAKQKQQAVSAAQADGTGPASQLAAANDALRQAHQRTADAALAVGNAERAVAQAIDSARQQIADSIAARADAYRQVQDAAQAVAQAEVDGMQAIRDAAEEASDAVLDLKQAQLDAESAQLDTEQAQLNLKELRGELGATGAEFDDTFKKFTDVEFDFDKGALAGVFADMGIDEGSQDAIDMERAILAVRNARLNEKKATDSVGDSQRDLNEKQKEANRLARDGLAAYRPYADAVRALADAQADYTKQAAETAKLQKQGVAGNEGVISAQQQLAQARRESVDAARAEARQEQQTAEVRSGMTPQMKRLKQLWDDLSESERQLAKRLFGGRDAALAFIRQGTDPMMDALSGVIDHIREMRKSLAGQALLGSLATSMKIVGTALGRLITEFANFATSPQGVIIFAQGAALAKRLIGVLAGGAMQNAIRLIGNLGRAFGPGLVHVLQIVARGIKSIADSTSGLGPGTKSVRDLMFAFRQILRLAGAVGDAIVAFAVAASKPGGQLVRWLREGLEAFTKWMRSAEGQKAIKQFFAEAIPFVKTMITFVAKLATTFFQLFEFFAPALNDLFKGFNAVLDAVNFLLNVVNKLPAPFKSFIAFLIPGLGQIKGGFLAARIGIRAFSVSIGTALVILGVIGRFGKTVFKPLIGAIKRVLPFVTTLVTVWNPFVLVLKLIIDLIQGGFMDAVNAIASIGEKAFKGLLAAFNWVVDAAKKAVEAFFNVGKRVVQFLWRGVKSLAGLLKRAGEWVIDKITDGIKGAANVVAKLATWWWQHFRDGFTRIFNFLTDLGGKLLTRLVNGFKRDVSLVTKLGSWLWTHFRDAVHAVRDQILALGGWILNRVIDGVRAIATKFFDLGQNLIKALIRGIKSMGGKVLDTIKDLGGGIVGKIGGVLGINSPSKVFMGIGADMVGGLIVGLKKQTPAAKRAVGGIFKDLSKDPLNAQLGVRGPIAGGRRAPRARPALAGVASGTVIQNQQVTLPAPPTGGVMDPRYAAVQFAREMKRRGW